MSSKMMVGVNAAIQVGLSEWPSEAIQVGFKMSEAVQDG